MDYFPEDDWLLVVDESHVSAPQLGAMWGGDQARKRKLVEHGFRLPSALDNRPLKVGGCPLSSLVSQASGVVGGAREDQSSSFAL